VLERDRLVEPNFADFVAPRDICGIDLVEIHTPLAGVILVDSVIGILDPVAGNLGECAEDHDCGKDEHDGNAPLAYHLDLQDLSVCFLGNQSRVREHMRRMASRRCGMIVAVTLHSLREVASGMQSESLPCENWL